MMLLKTLYCLIIFSSMAFMLWIGYKEIRDYGRKDKGNG